MNEQDFLAQYGTNSSSSDEDDFIKKFGVQQQPQSPSLMDQVNAGVGAAGDLIMGIPKFGAAAIGAGAMRLSDLATGNKGSLNDAYQSMNQAIENQFPSYQNKDIAAYKYPMMPFDKFGQGVDYLGDKAADLTGSQDVGGAIKIGANLLPIHLLAKGAGKMINKAVEDAPKVEPTMEQPTGEPLTPVLSPEDQFMQQYGVDLKQRAENMTKQAQYEESLKQMPPDVISVNQEGNAGLPEDMNALSRSTEGIQYEQIPPDGSIPGNSPSRGITVPRNVDERWSAPDENGIPVRQGLPQEPDTLPVQDIAQDQSVVHDLGNAIQEANGPKLGPDEDYGSGNLNGDMGAPDVEPNGMPQTVSPQFNSVVGNLRSGKIGSQRGGINSDILDPLVKAINATRDLVGRTSDQIADFAKKPVSRLVGMLPEDHMARVSGLSDLVYKPKAGEEFLKDALAEGTKNTSLWKNMQSGAHLAGEKVQSAALKGIGSWLSWNDKRTHYDNRQMVDPIQGQLKKLSNTDATNYNTLSKVLMREQATRTLYSPEQLSRMLPPKAVEAYQALRKGFEDAYQKTNETRQKMGQPPVTREEAYHASMRHGDWKMSVFDKDGKLIWHDASSTALASKKAENWIRQKLGDDVKVEKWNSSETESTNIPKDIMETYHNALKFIDPHDPLTTLLSDSIQKFNDDRGQGFRGQDQRFLDKNNIPGFEGNKPWLSDRENADAFMNAQMGYLRNSNRWNNFQEALQQMQPILKNEDLIRNQPNIMKVAAAHVNRELGLTNSIFRDAEKVFAKSVGISRGNIYNTINSLKHATYLTQLGFNPALALTVPIQSLLAVAQHRVLTLQGHEHSVLSTLVKSMADTSAGLARHTLSSMTGKHLDISISDLGKKILQYAEDNGILDKTVLDESGPLKKSGILSPVTKTLGATITAPEKLARFSTFAGFVHHLMADGKMSEADAMLKAEEFTNNSITSMRRSDRPIVVDRAGSLGQLAYTYKSFLFNEYNQLSQFAHEAKRGNISPLALHLGALMTLGGALALPGINELSDGWEGLKSLIAKATPEHYGSVSGLSIKGQVLRDLPTWASLGPVSGLTGTNIGTRSNVQIGELTNPLGNLAAPAQEFSEWVAGGKALLHPTDRRGWEEALHANAPPALKALMETKMDDYKNPNPTTPDGRNPDGTMSYRKSSDIEDSSTDYKRTAHDETVRKLGMYSDTEYKTKQIRGANNSEQSRVNDAYDESIKKAMTFAGDGKQAAAQQLIKNAITLIPDQDKLVKAINDAATAKGLTPEERELVRVQSMNTLQKVLRANGTK